MAGFTFPDYRIPVIPAQGVIPAQSIEAPIGAFGGQQAQALEKSAQNLERTSDNLMRTYVQVAEHQNEAEAKEADARLGDDMRELLFNSERGYFAARGRSALDRAKPTLEALVELRQKYLEGMSSPAARRMFDNQARRRLEQAEDQIARHTTQERRSYQDLASEARVRSSLDDAVASFDDTKAVNEAMTRAVAEIRSQAEVNKEPPEETERKVKAAESVAVSGVVRRWLDVDPYRAKSIRDQNGDKLLGDEARVVDHLLKEALIRRGSSDRADSIRAGGSGQGAYGNNIGNITRSNFPYAGGKGAPQGAFETFETPEHGVAAAYITAQAKARQNGGTISFLDLIAGNDKVKGWAAADDGKTQMLRGNDPKAYAARLAQAAGLKPTDAVPLGDDGKMAAIFAEMNRIEKGKVTVPEGAFAAGIVLAKGGGQPAPVDRPDIDQRTGKPTLEWQVKQAEKIQDPELRDATLARVRSLHSQDEAVHTEQRRKIALDVQNMITTNNLTDESQIPTEKWAALEADQKRAFLAQMDRNGKGKDNAPNPALYAELSRQMVEDPEGFKKRDLVKEADKLPTSDWKHFQNMQVAMGRRANSEEEKLASIAKGLQISDAMLKSAGIYLGYADSKGKVLKAKEFDDFKAQYQSALLKEFESFQAQNKRRPNDDEMNKMADRLLMQGRLRGTGLFNEDKALGFQRPSGENAPEFYIRYADIPAADRKRFEDRMKAKGLPTDKKAVENAYTAWRAAGSP